MKRRRINWINLAIVIVIMVDIGMLCKIGIDSLVAYLGKCCDKHLESQITVPDIEAEEPQIIFSEEEPQMISLGEFKLTGYCDCEQCSEGWGRMTASGKEATSNHTIAVDPNVIPLGTEVIINGTAYVAEDVGGAINGNRIDIFCETHQDCFSESCNGYAEVFVWQH